MLPELPSATAKLFWPNLFNSDSDKYTTIFIFMLIFKQTSAKIAKKGVWQKKYSIWGRKITNIYRMDTLAMRMERNTCNIQWKW